jgi:hypothetical protein
MVLGAGGCGAELREIESVCRIEHLAEKVERGRFASM